MLRTTGCSAQCHTSLSIACPGPNIVRLRLKGLRSTWFNKTSISSEPHVANVQCRASNSPKASAGSEEPYLPAGWFSEWWKLFLKTQGPYWFGGAWAIILFALYRAVKQSQLDKLAQIENLDQFL